MFFAHRGFSAILFASVAALGVVLLTDPAAATGNFSDVFAAPRRTSPFGSDPTFRLN